MASITTEREPRVHACPPDALGNTVALQLIKSMSDRRTDIQEEIDEAQAQLSQAEQAITKLEHAIAQW